MHSYRFLSQFTSFLLLITLLIPQMVIAAPSVPGLPEASYAASINLAKIAFAYSGDIYVMNTNGSNVLNLTHTLGFNAWPTWSPDGQRIAFETTRNGNLEIYVTQLDGSGLVNLTQHSAEDGTPDWSPNGKKIVFHSNRTSYWEIWTADVDNRNVNQLTNDGHYKGVPIWSPDGSKIAYDCNYNNLDICLFDVVTGTQTRLTNWAGNERRPYWSPDGRKIVFDTDLGDDYEIYTINIDGSGITNLTQNTVDDILPSWDSGNLILFSSAQNGGGIFTMDANGNNITKILSYGESPVWQPLGLTLPDLDVAYIERTPRYNYDAPKNKPADGDMVTYVAHIANRGQQPTGSFIYTWYIDGIPTENSVHPGMAPGQMTTLPISWKWATGPHSIKIALDPQNLIIEASELNNAIEDPTNAIAVGFWVEQSTYDWFNQHQFGLGLGSTSWDDWAQRQLRNWNQIFAEAISPLTPQGILERVRLDEVTIIADGTWPDCGNWPAQEDLTVDLIWGFTSEGVGVNSGHKCGELNFYSNHPDFQIFEPPLLHEISHARYLIDLYGLNVYVDAIHLTNSLDSISSVLTVDQNIEINSNFSPPVYLAIDGELLICQSKAGNSFTNCSRGGEGTTPRYHPANTFVHLATVRAQDGQGNLIQGSSKLPVIGGWNDHLYLNRYPDDMMSGGAVYNQHSAYAWNRILGQRPYCGNCNAPCNIGEYLSDIPNTNILEIRDLSGDPVAWAKVEVYQAKPASYWYGKYFSKTPDLVYFTDSQGQVNLGNFPFGPQGHIIHTYGYSTAVLLLRISSGAEEVFKFLEITEFNEAYWNGYHNVAIYSIIADLPHDKRPSSVFLPFAANNPVKTAALLDLNFNGTWTSADGEPGIASGATFSSGYTGQGALIDGTDTLTYSAVNNIQMKQGRIEFWLKPLWNGYDHQNYVFFEVGDTYFNRIRIVKDGGNYLRFIIWSMNHEYGVGYNIGSWKANEWHHVRVDWQDGIIQLYLDGLLRDRQENISMPSSLSNGIYIGSSSQADTQANAVLDDFVIYSAP